MTITQARGQHGSGSGLTRAADFPLYNSAMDQHRLHASSRLAEAEWLRNRLRPFGSGVASIVPDGFPAYVRILHPAYDAGGELLSWAKVAATCGRTMHRLAQFHAISPPKSAVAEAGASSPEAGNLEPSLLTDLCAVLRRHTETSETCCFCLWNGYGWLDDKQHSIVVFTKTDESSRSSSSKLPVDFLSAALRAAVLSEARVRLPARDYLLLEGPLEAAMDFGSTPAAEWFIPQSPNLFWPSDHAWCVASEIDLYCTLVAGSNELAEELLTHPRLEVWRVFADDPVHCDSDEVNK
jgi:hypothetical protein